ncbi:hypothetical protein BAY61_17765 [Prauserella marina]|uniref:Maleate isomerase n=1 Tax=Prauserella marina TaxID=530584 RepID=A0A222VRS5_9PSEU|nr:hypothetical protein [Prauserella marina]ASR36542.1 hypothetical protein BAY61_17765 [Prauserella marina]PWV73938.1 maleate isomerase [Prauserella marina]SDD59374.1 maleate isomerase [Prauserella marina]
MVAIRTSTAWTGFAPTDPAPSGTVGLLALATDAYIEYDLRGLLPPDVGMCTTRIANVEPLTVGSLRATAADVTAAAETILPGQPLDALIYGCTAGAAIIGHDEVAGLLGAAKPGAHCLTPVGSVSAALRALGVTRPAVLTPNLRQVNESIAGALTGEGFRLTGLTGFGISQDSDITRIPPEAIVEIASRLCSPGTDGLLICCTSLRSTPVIEELESLLGLPVVTSNQALAWDVARRLGAEHRPPGPGSLFRASGEPVPATALVPARPVPGG